MHLRLVAATVFLIIPLGSLESRGSDRPIPQNPEVRLKRERESLAWNEKTLVGAYDKVGKKNPQWDGLARDALHLMAQLVSHTGERRLEKLDVRAAMKKAVDAGCDDPLVVFSQVRQNVGAGETDDKVLADAVNQLVQSNYPAVRKATALYVLAWNRVGRRESDPRAVEDARRAIDTALALLPKSFAEDGAGTPLEHVWSENLAGTVTDLFKVTEGSLKAAYDRADAALSKVPAAKIVRLIYRGVIYKDYAWEARGTGAANTVSPENFEERLRESERALLAAWALNPGHVIIANSMLTVVMGLNQDRRTMEQWFERAMTLDDNNYTACVRKLYYLYPRWHGSQEEAVAFGRECRDTRNFASGIPLILAEVHLDTFLWLPKERQKEYVQNAEVWKDLSETYEERLRHYPDDTRSRKRYALFCWYAERYAEAAKQFQILGDRLVPDEIFNERLIQYARAESYSKAGAPP
jgi:hypothetical protein